MKYKAKLLTMIGVILYSHQSLAAVVHEFRPSVTIEDTSGEALEIYASQTMFEVPYSFISQSFMPLSIPFEVVSVKGNAVDYRLSAVSASAVCLNEETEENIKVEYRLDSQEWPASGLQYNGIRNAHVLDVAFPMMEQGSKSIQCEGQIGVQVELMTL
ncbi:hypothetical protein [Vibrio campbellii]|uniref:hypothetical protein n=1 Tax=Vibrio campbellii TaxID=680 RepID=UPI003857913A